MKDIELALNTYTKLLRAEARLSSFISAEELSASGLTISQFGVLEALLHKGDLTANELSAKLLKTKGNLTMVIDNLQKKGFVERRPCPKDRRRIYISLTPEGKDLINDIFPRHARSISDCMQVLTKQEQLQLGALCKKLGTSLN